MERYVLSVKELAEKWVQGELQNSQGKWYKEAKERFRTQKDSVYSYGNHFMLAYRNKNGVIIRNGDRWRINRISDTPDHQRALEELLPDNPMISFDTVSQIVSAKGIYNTKEFFDCCEFIETTRAFREYRIKGDSDWEYPIPAGATASYTYENEEPVSVDIHQIGKTLFVFKNPKTKEKEYFLASSDEGSYFISRLPKPVKSIEKALSDLKPSIVKAAELKNVPVLRQGEWFFIKIADDKVKELQLKKDSFTLTELKKYDTSRNSHLANVATVGDKKIATGMVRHVRRNMWAKEDQSPFVATKEHAPVRLGKDYWLVVLNTSIEDYSAVSKVD